jgi:hypothetical protein
MTEGRGLTAVVCGVFAALGVVTAVIAGAVASLVEGEVRSVFKAVTVIAIVLAALTGWVALAAWRKWWPLREAPAGIDPEV